MSVTLLELARNKNMRYSNDHRPFEDPLGIFPKALTKLYSTWVSRTYPFARIGRDVSFHVTSKLSRQRATRISLGNSVRLLESAWLSVATDDPTGEPTIIIEDNCSIGYGSILSGKNRVHLERDILVGQHVVIQDHNHAYEDIDVPVISQGITKGGRIRIGEGSWLARRVDHRPPLRGFRQFRGDAKHSRLFRGLWNACHHHPAIRSGKTSVAHGAAEEHKRCRP